MKNKKHIHNDPRIDCPACVRIIKRPLSVGNLYASGAGGRGLGSASRNRPRYGYATPRSCKEVLEKV